MAFMEKLVRDFNPAFQRKLFVFEFRAMWDNVGFFDYTMAFTFDSKLGSGFISDRRRDFSGKAQRIRPGDYPERGICCQYFSIGSFKFQPLDFKILNTKS